MKSTIKRMIKNTPLEGPARNLMRMLGLSRPSEWDLRADRDRELIRQLLDELLCPGSNCIDIGAHTGEFLDAFLERAPNGRHHAFEPLPDLARTLAKRYQTVAIHACALSNRCGSATFYHAVQAEAWSGLKKQHYPVDATPVEIQVVLQRLDDCIGPDPQIDFIKIDVEGAESEVLQGAIQTIRRCRPAILFEHARLHAEPYETSSEMLYDFLSRDCDMLIWDLARMHSFSRQGFRDICDSSHSSGYDRNAQTNFVALPSDFSIYKGTASS